MPISIPPPPPPPTPFSPPPPLYFNLPVLFGVACHSFMVGVALMQHRAMPVNESCYLSCADRQLGFVKAVVGGQPWSEILLVSSPYHPLPLLHPSNLSLTLLKDLISPSLSVFHPPPSSPPSPPPPLPSFSHLGRLSVPWKPGGHCVAGAMVS